MSTGETEQAKPLFWMGSTHKDLKAFPAGVRQAVGFALFQAQLGRKHVDAKVLKGFCGAGVLEVMSDFDGDTYRTVYGEVRQSCLCPPCFSEEIQEGNENTTGRA
jgi:phage-related protein